MASLLEQGGPVMVTIAGVSLLAWMLIAWKWLYLQEELRGGFGWVDHALAALDEGQKEHAMQLCRQHDNGVGRVVFEAISIREPQRSFFERRLQPLVNSESHALQSHLPMIGALGGLTPLLGLLGTVVGMVTAFDALAGTGARDAASLADGISQALLTTQAGLLMALPILILHGWLTSRVNQHLAALRLYVKKIETMVCRD